MLCDAPSLTFFPPKNSFLTSLQPLFQLKCTNCGEAPEHWQYVTIDEVLDVPGSRGEANLVEKCKLCNRVNTLCKFFAQTHIFFLISAILPDTVGSYKLEKNEKWQSIVVFDCRGVEPVDFDPRVRLSY